MIGFYNYTEFLTYLSAISAGLGILISLNGSGHPYLGVFFLMFSGLCDAFDGKVARTKKDRSVRENKFGIQIDSLSDIIAFGVLPACIGDAMIRVCPKISEITRITKDVKFTFPTVIFLFAILIIYILASLIRLAYFNVLEEERQKVETGVRKTYIGLPVTSAAIVFPTVLLVQYITPVDLTALYFIVMFVMAFLFVSKIKVPKPGMKGILIFIGIGMIEFVALIVASLFRP